MADVKINPDFTPTSTITDGMEFAVVTPSTSYRATVATVSGKILTTDLKFIPSLANAIQTTNVSANGLQETTTTLTEPAADQFKLTNGTTELLVTADCTIDQDLATTGSPQFDESIIGGSTIDGSAQFQIDSTDKGFLMPRMTTIERNAIVSPAIGLQVYDTTLNKLYVYNGTIWEEVGDGAAPTTFLDLTDTPSSYSATNAVMVVNSTPDGLVESSIKLDDSVANTVKVINGTTTLNVSANTSLNQDVLTTSNITVNSVTSTVPISEANGGTGKSSYANGQTLIGNSGGTLTANTLTAGDGIDITNGSGTITISSLVSLNTTRLSTQQVGETYSPSFTATAGSNRFVVLGIGVDNFGTAAWNGVKYAGVSMRHIDGAKQSFDNNVLDFFYLLEQDLVGITGSNSVVIDFTSQPDNPNKMGYIWGVYGNVNQATPFSTFHKDANQTASQLDIDILNCTIGDHAIGIGYGDDNTGTFVVTSPFTKQIEALFQTGRIAISDVVATASTMNCEYTASGLVGIGIVGFGLHGTTGSPVPIELIPNEYVYFVGKHGSDLNPGKNWDNEAFETFGKAITEINLQSPSSTNQFTIKCNDAGDYDEQIVIGSYTHIFAPNATLKSTNSTGHTLDISGSEYSVVKIKEISANSSDAALSCNQDATSAAYLDIDYVKNTGTGYALEALNGYTLGKIKRCQKIYAGTNSRIDIKTDFVLGNIDLIDGSDGSLFISDYVSGTLTKGSASSVSVQILNPAVFKTGNTIIDPIWSYSSHPTFTADSQIPDIEHVNDLISAAVTDHYVPNVLIGADYSVNPRQEFPVSVSAINDATYGLDNTIILSDGNGVVDVSSLASDEIPMTLTWQQANKQAGFLIPIENRDVLAALKLLKASLLIRFKWTGTATPYGIRMALLKWTGTADSIVRDPVSTWAGSGTNPTLVTNWNYVNVPTSNLTAASTGVYQIFKIEDIDITTPFNNFGIFVWTDSTAININAQFSVTNVKLTYYPIAGEIQSRSAAEELTLCRRYYAQSSKLAAYQATYDGSMSLYKYFTTSATAIFGLNVSFPTPMRANTIPPSGFPTLTPYSPQTGASGYIRDETTGVDLAAVSARVSGTGGQIHLATPSTVSPLLLSAQWIADARL